MWQHVCNTKYVIYHVKIFILSLLHFIVVFEFCIQITRLFGMKMVCYAYHVMCVELFKEVMADPIQTRVDGGKCGFKARKI